VPEPPIRPAWGIRFNTSGKEPYYSPSSSKAVAAWLHGYHRDDWESKQGVVLCDDGSQKMHVLGPHETLKLLQELRQSKAWQQDGITVRERARYWASANTPERKRSRNQGAQEESVASESKPDYEYREEERIRLNPQAVTELFTLLEQHEAELKQIIEANEKHRIEVLGHAYSMILSWADADAENRESS
jgi:hypothetical protein